MNAIARVGSMVIPLMLLLIPLYGFVRGVKVMDCFIQGAENGLRLVLRIAPYMIAMFAALASFRASGIITAVANTIARPLVTVGLTPDLITLAFLRPISGSGSMAVASEILKVHGPDSFLGFLAGTMQGSNDTTFYVVAVYFGAIGVTRIRHSLTSGLVGDFASAIGAVILCNLLFR